MIVFCFYLLMMSDFVACVACNQEVRRRQHAIACDKCDRWQHRTCGTGITIQTYRKAVKNGEDIQLVCKSCASRSPPIAEETTATARETRSSRWRKQGNLLYLLATDSLSPTMRLSKFQEANECYRKAYLSTEDDNEAAFAAKNVGAVMWKMGMVSSQAGERWVRIKYYFKEAIRAFNIAHRKGTSCKKPKDWSDNILASCRGCWEDFRAFVETQTDNHERVLAIREFIDFIPIAHMTADCFMDITEWYKETKAMLKNYQKKTLVQLQEEEKKRKAGVKEKIKPKVELLNEHEDDNHVDFLKFVYRTLKPWNPHHTLRLPPASERIDRFRQYKLLQAAIIHYHPDKVKEADHGLEAKVLHEEITKLITARYNSIKKYMY